MAIRIRVYPQPGSIGAQRNRARKRMRSQARLQQRQFKLQQQMIRQQQLMQQQAMSFNPGVTGMGMGMGGFGGSFGFPGAVGAFPASYMPVTGFGNTFGGSMYLGQNGIGMSGGFSSPFGMAHASGFGLGTGAGFLF